ncbi:MAG: hypothetical protein C5B50_13970 [Verrucomicrobia bacterium]|nr:MAG: hypothetical protein C5B50_13970 [Verrucomicrobiota bacterium]
MKKIFSLRIVAISAGLFLSGLVGCQKESSQSDTSPQQSSAPKAQAVSAIKNSFQETTSRLDAGGNFYLYLSTEQFLDGLSTKVAGLREIISAIPNIEGVSSDTINKGFNVVTHLIKTSGLEDVSGFGMSSIAIEKDMCRSKIFVHHYPGKGKGFLWTLGGKKAHPLTELDLLPASTALAMSSDFDMPGLWSLIRDEVAQADCPEAKEFLDNLPQKFEETTGMKWDQLLASLGGEFGIALTLDEAKKFPVPLPTSKPLQIPEPGLMLLAKANDDTVFKRIAAEMEKNAGQQMVSVDKPDLKMRTLPLPLPLPIQLRPTVALSGGYLFIATTDSLIQEALDVKAGKKPGLKAQDEFKHVSKDLPTQGNAFAFASQALSRTLMEIQKEALENAGDNAGPAKALGPLLQAQKPGFGYTVSANTDDGWLIVGNANHGQGKSAVAAAAIVPAAIAGAMVLPALAKAKSRAQSITCVNNMKQLGLAARVWGMDHNNALPPDFISMKAQLDTPKLLVCPMDKAHAVATDWASFTDDNCSYEFLAAGAKDDQPTRVAFRCKVHGSVGLIDGSVHIISKSGPTLAQRDGNLYLE